MRQTALIVGCGKIGKIYSEALLELGIELLGVSDTVPEKAERLARITGVPVFPDYRRLVSGKPADAVLVATPTESHREAAMAAAARGMNVFCEKPLGGSFQEASEMVEEADRCGVMLGVGFKFRFETVFAEAKRVLTERDLGEVLHVFINHFQPVPDIDWYLDEGVTIGLLVHAMDLSRWFTEADPIAARADMLHRLERRGDDQTFIEYRYGGGQRAMLYGGRIKGFPEVAGGEDLLFELICERGYIIGRRPDFLMVRDRVRTDEIHLEPVNAFKAELAAFFKALSRAEKPPVSGTDGLKAQAMIEAAFLSKENNGALIRFNPMNFMENEVLK